MSTKLFTLADGNLPGVMIRTPILPSQIVDYESGLEQRNRVRTYPRWRFDLQWPEPNKLDDVTVNTIANWFVEHGGNYETFIWLPPVDTTPLSLQVLGKGTGTRTLFKAYGNRYGSAQVFVDGSSVSATYSTGNATITLGAAAASGTVITATVQSERFVVRFLESMVNHEFFLWKLTRNNQFTFIQDGGDKV